MKLDTTNSDYSSKELEQIRAMVTDLWDLDFQSEVNTGDPAWVDKTDFVVVNDIAFPLAKLIILGFVEFDTLSEKALTAISETWSQALEEGYFSSTWE